MREGGRICQWSIWADPIRMNLEYMGTVGIRILNKCATNMPSYWYSCTFYVYIVQNALKWKLVNKSLILVDLVRIVAKQDIVRSRTTIVAH